MTLARTDMDKHLFKLYIAGNTTRSVRAQANLRRLCDELLSGQCRVEIIDVLEQPQLAEQQKILATPTLIRELPLPMRRVIGDLSDEEKVLMALDMSRAQRPD